MVVDGGYCWMMLLGGGADGGAWNRSACNTTPVFWHFFSYAESSLGSPVVCLLNPLSMVGWHKITFFLIQILVWAHGWELSPKHHMSQTEGRLDSDWLGLGFSPRDM